MAQFEQNKNPNATSVDDAEIGYFDALSQDWWDERGPFAALQAMTPARVQYITQHAARLLNTELSAPLRGITILDIGCGGGLLAEPLARLGAKVTGIDASQGAIAAATDHADRGGLEINYQHITAEALAETKATFDLVVASEVIEHVQDRPSFLRTMAQFGHADKPTGIVLTTINRSVPGVLLAKYAAEYVLKLAPKGTHDPAKFVRPSELQTEAASAGIDLDDMIGIRPSLKGGFALAGAPIINYAASGLVRR